MEYEIKRITAAAQLVAAVRARVPRGGIAEAYGKPLDKVWAFLRRSPGLRTEGHNLFLYHHDASDSGLISVDFGVQVVRRFEPDGDVRCIETPSGEVVTTVHRGPYSRLSGAHDSIHEWFRQQRRSPGMLSWEIYGDWTDDPRSLETTVIYLL